MNSHKLFSFFNPIYLINYFLEHRALIRQFTKREIQLRYQGSFFGVMWAIFIPLLMLSIYTFVFSVVFKGRWGTEEPANQFEFAVIMFCGLILFNVFNETINKAPTLIVVNINYVKKIIFPLEILPIAVILSSLMHAGISLLILLIMINLFFHITWTFLFSILIIFPLIFLTLGLSWFLSSLGVYIRDTAYTIGVVTNILFYITPIFYPISAVPDFMKKIMYINPLSLLIENFRRVIIFELPPNWLAILYLYLVSYLVMVLGLMWFIKTRKGFADVL